MAIESNAPVGGRSPAGLPVDCLRDALPHLRRPFTPEAIRFKVQNVFSGNTGCIVVAYIDARLVIDRLNAVCGDSWTARPVQAPDAKHMWCELEVFGVTRMDVGQSPKGFSKDLWSDALKRSAVQFGVGVSVYALPQITLRMSESRGRIELRGKDAKQTVALTEHGHVKLREGYARWLTEHGETLFGEPLNHGDVEGATFDEEQDVEAEAFVPEPPAAVTDERGEALIAECRSVYAEIRELGGGDGAKLLVPGTFNGWLTGAQHSHEELERLAAHLRQRRDEIAAQLAGAGS